MNYIVFMHTKKPSHILITRPQPEADGLAEILRREGHQVRVLPLLNIRGLTPLGGSQHGSFPEGQTIFISKNAVRYCPAKLLASLSSAYAVGPGTAEALRGKGVATVLAPSSTEGSDALLTLPELQNVEGQSFVIVRGTTGREVLADTLQARGARVTYFPVYEAEPAPLSNAELTLLRAPYDVIVLGSLSCLKRAIALGISPDACLWVLSQPMLDFAKNAGWKALIPPQ